MPREVVAPGSAGDWLQRARSDLEIAQMPRPERVFPEDFCFHAQQAAEKALKSLLAQISIPFPRTHNLATLLDLLPTDLEIPQEVQDAARLTDYAVTSRYPGDYEPVDEVELRDAVASAGRVVAWVEKRLGME